MIRSTININMNFQNDSELKQLEILDSNLNVVIFKWTTESSYNALLKEGVYAVRVTDPRGIEHLRSFIAGSEPNISVNIGNDDSLNEEKFNYKTSNWKDIDMQYLMNFQYPYDQKFRYDYNFIHEFLSERYRENVFPVSIFNEIDLNQSYKISTLEKPNSRLYLKYGGINFLVKLPINEEINISVSNNRSTRSSHELCFTVELGSKEAETLLRMLSIGEIGKAKSLFEHINYAEKLLYDKIENPSYASLGGYFLLRTNSIENLHHWPKNLADWFDWLPDGCIIHAAQLMRGPNPDLLEIRDYLLEACRRGIPQFTDGLKLLHEGLMRLHYMNQEDEVIIAAYKEVRNWLSCADSASAFTVLRSRQKL
ncbi:hypothetical protein [Flavobacterium sp. KACC 22763]|uniref:hypothetical protein n=1 Tax=Flavobacterium sp. KACC 22763 TaxID=3025668 RepID=UPI0023671FC5|nr:hypothetical protein [Flavobacterium sp. KACC 22763]WDF66118.1 hypothetical protein PQ463_08115 [Flavobacterium sp. KACC 22763]